jgi:hypothetical protein
VETVFAAALDAVAREALAAAAPVDAEAAWSRIEARISDLGVWREASGVRRQASGVGWSVPWHLAHGVQRWAPATVVVVACAVTLLGWRAFARLGPPPVEFAEVRLNLSLWQPDAIAEEPMGSATDELIALLEPGSS